MIILQKYKPRCIELRLVGTYLRYRYHGVYKLPDLDHTLDKFSRDIVTNLGIVYKTLYCQKQINLVELMIYRTP